MAGNTSLSLSLASIFDSGHVEGSIVGGLPRESQLLNIQSFNCFCESQNSQSLRATFMLQIAIEIGKGRLLWTGHFILQQQGFLIRFELCKSQSSLMVFHFVM